MKMRDSRELQCSSHESIDCEMKKHVTRGIVHSKRGEAKNSAYGGKRSSESPNSVHFIALFGEDARS